MNFLTQRHSPPGFTLVEVMVAMLITFIVMGGVYRTLSDEGVSHERSEKILDMQNNARVALERIVRDVRRTGFLGCGGTLDTDNLMNSVTTPTTFVNKYTVGEVLVDPPGLYREYNEEILPLLKGLAAGGTPVNFLGEVMGFYDNAKTDHHLYQKGTDAISLVYLSEERVWAGVAGLKEFNIDARGYKENDILYVTDCVNYSLFQKTNENDSTIVEHDADGLNKTTIIDKADAPQVKPRPFGVETKAWVYKLDLSTYFIHKGGGYELCKDMSTQPIASNIEDLQFEFLADENANGNLEDDPWRTDPTDPLVYPTGVAAVRAVRIWVLAMSEPDYSYVDAFNADGSKRLYVYPNSPYATQSPAELAPITSPRHGEKRHRYLASAVVYLRNAGNL